MLIPLNAGRRAYTGFPIATVLIIVLNVIVYLVEVLVGFENDAWYQMTWAGGFTPFALAAREGLGGLTAFTSMYLHGGFFHLFSNMLYLLVFGPQIEDLTGSGPFLLFYHLSGLVGNFLTLVLDRYSMIPGIGASGAIAGVMGAYLFLYPGQRVRTLILIVIIPLVFPLPAWALLGFWIVQQIIVGQVILDAGYNYTGIGVWAHIGGFVGGLLVIYLFLRKEVLFNRESVFSFRKR
jgi:membrane associated rhomboid family serine protease